MGSSLSEKRETRERRYHVEGRKRRNQRVVPPPQVRLNDMESKTREKKEKKKKVFMESKAKGRRKAQLRRFFF
jgi:hypothetical protein